MFTVEYIVHGSAFWTDETESNSADCVVKFAEFSEEMPFSAVKDDFYDHSELILELISSGEAGPVKSYSQWLAEMEALKEQFDADYRQKLEEKIKEINPDVILPGAADVDGDGTASTSELEALLNALKKKAEKENEEVILKKFGA